MDEILLGPIRDDLWAIAIVQAGVDLQQGVVSSDRDYAGPGALRFPALIREHVAEQCRNSGVNSQATARTSPNSQKSSEPPGEEAESAIPRLLRPDWVVLGLRDASRPDAGLVGKGMACEVAMEVEGHAGFA
jgi:hypothetical protein